MFVINYSISTHVCTTIRNSYSNQEPFLLVIKQKILAKCNILAHLSDGMLQYILCGVSAPNHKGTALDFSMSVIDSDKVRPSRHIDRRSSVSRQRGRQIKGQDSIKLPDGSESRNIAFRGARRSRDGLTMTLCRAAIRLLLSSDLWLPRLLSVYILYDAIENLISTVGSCNRRGRAMMCALFWTKELPVPIELTY